MALICSLILKYNRFHSVIIDTIIVFISLYLASELTELLRFSGPTASFFCGLTMNYFGLHNLSKTSQEFVQKAVKVATYVVNTIVYFQIGSNVFLEQSIKDVPWKFVLYVFIICCIARSTATFILSAVVNLKRSKTKISIQSQIMMIHSGVRGVIAYSLAINFPSHNQKILTTVTIWIIILTIFLLGCTTYDLIHLLKIPINCNYDDSHHGSVARQKKSIMATDDSIASRFISWVERVAIPFFYREENSLNESLLE